MPAGVTGYRPGPRTPVSTIDFSKFMSRFGNLVTFACILTVGVLHVWLEDDSGKHEAVRATVISEHDSLKTQLSNLEIERQRVEDAVQTVGPQGLGIPQIAPSTLLRIVKNRMEGSRLDRITYIPSPQSSIRATVHLEVSAPSNHALAKAVARLGEKPFLNPTITSAEERAGSVAARIVLETSGS